MSHIPTDSSVANAWGDRTKYLKDLADFTELVKHHDFSFNKADDAPSYCRGYESLNTINGYLVKRLHRDVESLRGAIRQGIFSECAGDG